MAHFAVLAPPLPGHFNPLLVLSRELVRRGHRVTFVNQPDAEALVRGKGVDFAAIGARSHPPGSLAARTRALGRLRGPIGLRGTIRDVASLTDAFCRDGPAVLSRIGADAVLADQMEAAGGLLAEHLRLPFASIATALPINREPAVPPPYLGWRYDPTERGIRRNEGGYRVADLLMAPVAETIARHAAALGLPPRRRAEECLSPVLQVAQAVAEIDYPRVQLPPAFHYVGPFVEAGEAAFELPEHDRPLAFCSFGTLQGGRAGLLRRVAAACADLGLCLVLAHGGRLSAEAARRLPGDTLVYDFVPQRAVLAKAAVAISHCGFNSVLDALSFGVPIVALPLAFEQPATAARLVRAGVGEMVPPLRRTRRGLRRALERVLETPAYGAAAGEVAARMQTAGGVGRAADLIEASLPGVAPRAAATMARAAPDDARDDSRSGSR